MDRDFAEFAEWLPYCDQSSSRRSELQHRLDAAEVLLKMRPKPLEVSDYEKRIAELERKLAVQQAKLDKAWLIADCEDASEETLDNIQAAVKNEPIELVKLLSEAREEGRKEAALPPKCWADAVNLAREVVDGREVTPYDITAGGVSLLANAVVAMDALRLPSSPSPASLNAKEGGE